MKSKNNSHILWVVFILLLVILVIILIGLSVFTNIYQNKIYPGISLGRFDLSGKNFFTALETLEQPVKQLDTDGLKFVYQDKEVRILPHYASTSGDVNYDILSFDLTKSVQTAYNLGRGKRLEQNLWEQLNALLFKKHLELDYQLNEKELFNTLQENFAELETPTVEAQLMVDSKLNFSVQAGKPGQIVNYQEIINEVKTKVENLDFTPTKIQLEKDYPRINQENSRVALEQAKNLIKDNLVLSYQDKTWEIKPAQLATWLELKWAPQVQNPGLTDSDASTWLENYRLPNLTNSQAPVAQVTLGLKSEPVEEYLDNTAKEVNIPVQEGKFYLNPEDKLVQFQSSQEGLELNKQATITEIEQELIIAGQQTVELVVDVAQPEVNEGNVEEMGIKERIGIGESNFAGSPRNRIHNIGVGSDILNGLLIKPNQEFSLLKALGKTDASTGYLPELVIKGKKVVPEYGGGLCQVGTTMFRVALDTGLPITERQNHSFQVSYYIDEQGKPGKDATIYDPSPDLKFINDTGHYILIRSRIEGGKLMYEFWGTLDGRKVEIGVVSVAGRTSSPGTIEEETDDLAPGEQTCSGHNVAGITAEFDYQVTYPNGDVKKQTFVSKYKAFSEICLVGRQPEQPAEPTQPVTTAPTEEKKP